MRTTRARIAAFFRSWQRARDEVKQARDERRDEHQAEELDMAREGLFRRPTGGSGLSI